MLLNRKSSISCLSLGVLSSLRSRCVLRKDPTSIRKRHHTMLIIYINFPIERETRAYHIMSQWQKMWKSYYPWRIVRIIAVTFYLQLTLETSLLLGYVDWDAWLEVKKKSCFSFLSREAQTVSSCLWRFMNRVDEELLSVVCVQLSQHSCSLLSHTFVAECS